MKDQLFLITNQVNELTILKIRNRVIRLQLSKLGIGFFQDDELCDLLTTPPHLGRIRDFLLRFYLCGCRVILISSFSRKRRDE